MTDPDFHGGDFYGTAVSREGGLTRGAHDRPHHVPVRRRRWKRSSGGGCATGKLFVRARVPDRVLPALPGREVLRVLRRQHLPADHQGARLLRSGARRRRRSRQSARAGDCEVPGDLVHHRLALLAVRARARSCRRWCATATTSTTPRSIAPHGHDAFLLDDPQYHAVVREYFDAIAKHVAIGRTAMTATRNGTASDSARISRRLADCELDPRRACSTSAAATARC